MLAVPLFNMQGERLGEVEIDPATLGGEVRPALLKQAVVMFQDHQRKRCARTKGRGDVEGSTRKIYRQKGTGNARMGTIRTPIRRGGGRAFARRIPGAYKEMPKKMRRLARNNAVLAKIRSDRVLVVDSIECSEPKTKVVAGMLKALGIKRGCLLALEGLNRNVFLSGRNLPATDIRTVDELSAFEVLRRPQVVFSRPALERLIHGAPAAAPAGGSESGEG